MQSYIEAIQQAVDNSGGLRVPRSFYDRLTPLGATRLRTPKVMTTPPTVGTVGAATAIGSPQNFEFMTSNQAASPGFPSINESFCTTTIGGQWKRAGVVNPDYFYGFSQSAVDGVPGANTTRVEFMVDCTTFEFMYKGVANNWRMWVDDDLVSATPVAIPANGLRQWQPITFASRGVRHIKIDFQSNIRFGGVIVGPTDAVWPAISSRPRALFLGDSYTLGSQSAGVDGWVTICGELLGWDAWAGGVGGTGFDIADSPIGYFNRALMYAGMPFDVIVVQGSVNDCDAGGALSMITQAPLTFQRIRDQWPNALIFATSIMRPIGVELLLAAGGSNGGYYRTNSDLIRQACERVGGKFINLINMPSPANSPLLPGAATGALTSQANAAATTFVSTFQFSIGSTVELGVGLSNTEMRRITNVSGTGPYTNTCAALTNAHVVGETVRQVGNSWCTGSGRVGSLTGIGTGDIYMASDNIHPTTAGHYAMGRCVAQQIVNALQFQ